MTISARSVLMAGCSHSHGECGHDRPVGTTPPAPKPDDSTDGVESSRSHTAAAQPLASPAELAGFVQAILLAAGASARPRRPPGIAPPPSTKIPGHQFIDSIYLAIEPWVAYGFEVGAWAFGWVP